MGATLVRSENVSGPLIGISDMARLLGVRLKTLYSWVHQRKIPYVKVGRLVKFDQKDIATWIAERKVKVADF
jgi:excisionase family DNA binding protein